jgi:hypothetical protein
LSEAHGSELLCESFFALPNCCFSSSKLLLSEASGYGRVLPQPLVVVARCSGWCVVVATCASVVVV